MPVPIAMSSAEAEYNACCTATMSGAHHHMLLNELRLRDPDAATFPIPVVLDSRSAQAMGNSFRDTKHTRHIARRYHYVRTGAQEGHWVLHWCEAGLQLADVGTKNLPGRDLQPRLGYIQVEVPK